MLLIVTMILCIISWCYPWKALPTRRGMIALQLPWIAVATYGLYEVLMGSYNIRVDLLFGPVLVGFGLVTFSLYVKRMVRAAR